MNRGKIRRSLLPFEDQYAQIPNAWLRDPLLSYRARGILAMLLSHREGWAIGVEDMTTPTERKDAVRTAVRELEARGYLIRERIRDAQGKLGAVDWILTEPVDNPVDNQGPMADEPPLAHPTT